MDVSTVEYSYASWSYSKADLIFQQQFKTTALGKWRRPVTGSLSAIFNLSNVFAELTTNSWVLGRLDPNLITRMFKCAHDVRCPRIIFYFGTWHDWLKTFRAA